MPGYIIHLAVAQEYVKKHTNKPEQYEEFIEGVIAPDSVKDKSKTHYGPASSKSNLHKFLESNDIQSSYKRGYFLHLLTDYLFYNKYINKFSKEIVYNDYDILNKGLLEKYKVDIPEKVKKEVFFKDMHGASPKILSKELVEGFINDISDLDIDNIAKDVIENEEKWTQIRPLTFVDPKSFK